MKGGSNRANLNHAAAAHYPCPASFTTIFFPSEAKFNYRAYAVSDFQTKLWARLISVDTLQKLPDTFQFTKYVLELSNFLSGAFTVLSSWNSLFAKKRFEQ